MRSDWDAYNAVSSSTVSNHPLPRPSYVPVAKLVLCPDGSRNAQVVRIVDNDAPDADTLVKNAALSPSFGVSCDCKRVRWMCRLSTDGDYAPTRAQVTAFTSSYEFVKSSRGLQISLKTKR